MSTREEEIRTKKIWKLDEVARNVADEIDSLVRERVLDNLTASDKLNLLWEHSKLTDDEMDNLLVKAGVDLSDFGSVERLCGGVYTPGQELEAYRRAMQVAS